MNMHMYTLNSLSDEDLEKRRFLDMLSSALTPKKREQLEVNINIACTNIV